MGTSYFADFGTNARTILKWILYRRVKSSGMCMLYQLVMQCTTGLQSSAKLLLKPKILAVIKGCNRMM